MGRVRGLRAEVTKGATVPLLTVDEGEGGGGRIPVWVRLSYCRGEG